MKRGLLIGLAWWAVSAAVYWFLLRAQVRPPLVWFAAVGLGFVMAVVIGTIRIGLAAARDALRVSQATVPAMGEKPEDGAVVTITGPIEAVRSTLHAPFSEKAAVAYTYEISHTEMIRDEMRIVRDYSGCGLAPASIRSIRLLGFPVLDAFDKVSPDHAPENAAKYIAETQFTDLTSFQPVAMYRELKDVLTGDEGTLRKDWRMTTDTDLSRCDIVEQLVMPGEHVTAIGVYSAAKGGLVADAAHPLELIRGEATTAAGTLWRKAASNIAAALFFALVVNLALLFVSRLTKSGAAVVTPARNDAKLVFKIQDLDQAARSGDVARIEQLVKSGVPVDGRGVDRSTALMDAADLKTTQWLIAHGADVNATNEDGETPLMQRARAGDVDSLKLLIRSGAKVDTVSTKWKATALKLALDAEKLDVVQALREAGAADDTVNETNGQPVTGDSDAVRVCREYVDAVQREDRGALERISTLGPFNDVDFKLWKSVRFANGRLISGFANDHAATIVMRGATPAGEYVTRTYQLVRQAGAWKISDERWETRFDGPQP